jgi:3-oxoacyl-[acyl-carrier protein] reductase
LLPGFSAYSAVKAGLNAFSKTLALEEGASGITVNIVAPGKVASATDQSPASAAWAEAEAHQLAASPLGRHATAEDVADAVLFFASAAAVGLTGQTLFVAGGEIMP